MQTMVPREDPRTPPVTDPKTALHALLAAWRHMLAALVPGIGRGVKTVLALFKGEANDAAATPAASVAAGCIALVVGIVVWSSVEVLSGSTLLSAVASAVVGSSWVLARLFIMRVAASTATTKPVSVSRAWAAGTLPWVFAGVSPLRPVTWVVGLALTVRMLLNSNVVQRDTWFIAGAGFGFEVVGLAIAWLARNAIVGASLLS